MKESETINKQQTKKKNEGVIDEEQATDKKKERKN